jgi:formate dehydrogenase (coenzyme F420) alpha subunit
MSKSERKRFSRRSFVKTAASLPALLPGGRLLGQRGQEAQPTFEGHAGQTQQPQQLGGEITFTRQSAALQPDKIVDSACQFCNSLCRLKVQMKSGRVIDILGEPDDPVQAGNFCVKGPMIVELAYNRHRLTNKPKKALHFQ